MPARICPQREPIKVISFTMAGAVSIGTTPCTVDFMTTVPRGMHIAMAARRPSADPVASTTIGKDRSGSFLPIVSVVTPADSAIRSLCRCLPKRCTCCAVRLEHLRDQQAELAVA